MMIPQKIKYRINLGSSNSTSGYIPIKNESRGLKDICKPLFIAALFVIALKVQATQVFIYG